MLGLLTLVACIESLNQAAGTGAVYITRCASEMSISEDSVYTTRCTPPPCEGQFESGPISHAVVTIEPGRRIVGNAERVCIQDLAQATGLFNPALFPEEPTEPPPAERPPPEAP